MKFTNMFSFEKKSELFADPKIKKIRIISKTMFIIGAILIAGSFFLFWDKFPDMEVSGIDILLKPPFPFIIAGIILITIGSLIYKIAIIKAGIKSFKTDDNPFFKEKERITNEVNEMKNQFTEMKNSFDNKDNENKE